MEAINMNKMQLISLKDFLKKSDNYTILKNKDERYIYIATTESDLKSFLDSSKIDYIVYYNEFYDNKIFFISLIVE